MTVSTPVLSPRNTVWYGWTLALTNTLLFSIGPSIMKTIVDTGMSATNIITIRYLAATLLLGLTLGLTQPQRLRIDRYGLTVCMGAGLIFGLSFFMFTLSLRYLSVSISSMIIALTPLVVLIILAFRGEKFTYRNGVRLLLGLLGVYFLIGVSGKVSITGVLLALGVCLTYATYLVLIQVLKEYDGQTVLFYIFATTALCAALLWLAQGGVWETIPRRAWLGLGAIVIFITYLAQLCLFIAVCYIGTGQMALLNPLETFLAIIWAIIFLQEQLTPAQWLGGGLILLSMFLAIKRIRRAKGMSWRPRLRLRF